MKKVEAAAVARKGWMRPEIKKISAGSAEAIQISGVPDGGPPGTSRS